MTFFIHSLFILLPSNTHALGSRIFFLLNFINKMCIYNVYEPVWHASLWNKCLYELCPIFLIQCIYCSIFLIQCIYCSIFLIQCIYSIECPISGDVISGNFRWRHFRSFPVTSFPVLPLPVTSCPVTSYSVKHALGITSGCSPLLPTNAVWAVLLYY